VKSREDLNKKSKELQDYAARKHEITTALSDPNRVEDLKKEEKTLTGQIEEIKSAWVDIKQHLEQELEKKKHVLGERKIEYQYKADQIKQMKKEISDSLREMKYKEELIKFLEEEYAKTPKGKFI
jgi:hypothetical protein